jgi:hypothetical protein
MNSVMYPYTNNPCRLQDVIAALHCMATDVDSTVMGSEDWGSKIGRTPISANDWHSIFLDHPEFFRISKLKNSDEKKASLVIRVNQLRNWYKKEGRVATAQEMGRFSANQALTELAFPVLSADQIQFLTETAISLHETELNRIEKRRWWQSIVVSGVSILASVASIYIVWSRLPHGLQVDTNKSNQTSASQTHSAQKSGSKNAIQPK